MSRGLVILVAQKFSAINLKRSRSRSRRVNVSSSHVFFFPPSNTLSNFLDMPSLLSVIISSR